MSIKAMKLALEAFKLIAVQDQGCGGNVSEAEAWRSAKYIARAKITEISQAIEQAQNQEHGIQVFFELDLQTGKAWQSAKVKRIQQENGDTCVYLDHWLEPKEPPQHALMAEHWKAEYDKLKAQRQPLTDEMVLLGAKALAKRHADSCGLDFDDVWKYYADEHKDDAKAVLLAAHGIKEKNT